MKKTSLILIPILILLALSLPSRIFAQTSPVPQQINARVLPFVWYSSLSINEGDTVRIYSGIQNNSGVDFNGTATFYVDDKEISKSTFTSGDNSLKSIYANWMASPGTHGIQVKVTTSLPPDKILVSYESDKSNVDITKKITKETIESAILDTASNVVSKTDAFANVLADKIENLKKPTDVSSLSNVDSPGSENNPKVNSVSSSKQNKGSVLGASTGPIPNQNTKIQSAFNIALDALAFLVRNWVWTLGGILLLFLMVKVLKKR